MTLELYAQAIGFRFVKPESRLKWYNRLNHRLARIGITLEIANTIMPIDCQTSYQELHKLVRTVPKMSTFAIAAIINKAVSAMPTNTAFVNVGVWHGFSFLSGIVNNHDRIAMAIDNFSQFKGPKNEFIKRLQNVRSPKHQLFEMDFERYFATIHRDPIGFYIYDGEHSYHNQLTGLEVAEPFFAKGCVVLVDDTNDAEPRRATLDFMRRHPGRYRLIFDRSTLGNSHPTFWNGIMLFICDENIANN